MAKYWKTELARNGKQNTVGRKKEIGDVCPPTHIK
jgi:hypothetical protein